MCGGGVCTCVMQNTFQSGALEPVPIVGRHGRTGLGAETPEEAAERKRLALAKRLEAQLAARQAQFAVLDAQFRAGARERFLLQRAEKELARAQGAVEDLDTRAGVADTQYMWRQPGGGGSGGRDGPEAAEGLEEAVSPAAAAWPTLSVSDRLARALVHLR